MRNITTILFVFLLLLLLSSNYAFAGSSIAVKINGEAQDYTCLPQIIDNRVMLPVREIFNSLGASVTWESKEKRVVAIRDNTVIKLKPGYKEVKVNSDKIILQQPAVIIKGKTMVPVRFVSESLGAKVSWNENTKTVLISFDKLTKEQDKSNNTPIISSAKIGVKQAQQWAKSRGASDVFIELAELYWELVDSHGGVNPAGAYAQAAKETGFGKFNGVVSENYKNPCGMKIHEGGANNDPGAHQKFNTWEDGVAAHLDHLALYAGAPGYPKNVTTDPRHFSVIKGRASSFEELGGNWAPSGEYGESLVKRYLNPLLYPEN